MHTKYPFHREHSKHSIFVLKTNQNQCRIFSCWQQTQLTNNRTKAICFKQKSKLQWQLQNYVVINPHQLLVL